MPTPSLHKSFDTSLIDVTRSFSSTEYATSEGSSAKENQPPTREGESGNAPGRILENVKTSELYEEWAATYDSDGNFLQAVDDVQMQEVLPKISGLVAEHRRSMLRVLDLGCGTGRTTIKLMQHLWPCEEGEIEGWDASGAMLEVAKRKCRSFANQDETRSTAATVTLRQIDLSDPNAMTTESEGSFDVVTSTLVLEHFPRDSFFRLISRLLKPGGVAFVSNMHPDMGAKSVAGYDDERGTRRIASSWIHGVGESIEAAREVGLEVIEVTEVDMEERWIEEGCVSERGRKWVGHKVWLGMVVRKV